VLRDDAAPHFQRQACVTSQSRNLTSSSRAHSPRQYPEEKEERQVRGRQKLRRSLQRSRDNTIAMSSNTTFDDSLSLHQCQTLQNLLNDGQKDKFDDKLPTGCSIGPSAGNGGYHLGEPQYNL
jgi:hypothetical protein